MKANGVSKAANGESQSRFRINSRTNSEILNPFVHKLDVNLWEALKIAVFSVTIAPVRLVLMIALLILAWAAATVALYGLSPEDSKKKPFAPWRRYIKTHIIRRILRSLFFVAGFHWLKVKGTRATCKEAPILVLAPHSSYLDTILVVFLGGPSIVAKGETQSIPFWGKLIDVTQPVYVWREDPNSRQNTIHEIQCRARSDLDYGQVLIFPEGTCTNRNSLITFKPGAFYPAVGVQPICISYKNKFDTVTWTWEGPNVVKLFWFTLCQFQNCIEIEFLPVHKPTKEEMSDARLFGRTVRDEMAKALDLPVADYTYDDCRLMSKAAQNNLPIEVGLVEVLKLTEKLGLNIDGIEAELARYASICRGDDGLITIDDFADHLKLPANDPDLIDLFSSYDMDGVGKIDFRQYLMGLFLICKPANTEEAIRMAFQLFDKEGKGRITVADLTRLLKAAFSMTAEESLRVFKQVDTRRNDYITYDEFCAHAQSRPEYAKIFLTKRHKFTKNNGRLLSPRLRQRLPSGDGKPTFKIENACDGAGDGLRPKLA